MRTPIKWTELHNPLFLGGCNLGIRLDPKVRHGLVMEWDEDKRSLYITYNKDITRVTETGIFHMKEGHIDSKEEGVVFPPLGKPVTAQVSTPQSHVFEGVGAGKVGDKK